MLSISIEPKGSQFLSLISQVMLNRVNSFLAGSALFLAAFVVVVYGLSAHFEIALSNDGPSPVAIRPSRVSVQVLGNTAYSTKTLFNQSNVKVLVTPFDYSYAWNKWNYKIQWNRMKNRSGSITINGNPFVYDASGAGENFTGYFIEPNTNYRVVFYSQANFKGTKIVNRVFKSLPAETDEPEDFGEASPVPSQTVCPSDIKYCTDGSYVSRVFPSCEFAACPSTSSLPSAGVVPTKQQSFSQSGYGYMTLDVGMVPQNSWREGWVESVYKIGDTDLVATGWAYEQDKYAVVEVKFQNMSTGQLYPASLSYSDYRTDVKEYLYKKTGKYPTAVANAFIAKAADVPTGNYKLIIASYNSYPFNIHGGALSSPSIVNNTPVFSTKQNSYGYYTLDVGTVKQGSWKEGWVEWVNSFASNTMEASGWAYDQDKYVNIYATFQNINTGQIYNSSTVSYSDYRADVKSYLTNKTGKTPTALANAFTVKATGLPAGTYKLLTITYGDLPFNMHSQSYQPYGVPVGN